MFIPVFCFHLHLAKWPSGARFVQALREGFFFSFVFALAVRTVPYALRARAVCLRECYRNANGRLRASRTEAMNSLVASSLGFRG